MHVLYSFYKVVNLGVLSREFGAKEVVTSRALSRVGSELMPGLRDLESWLLCVYCLPCSSQLVSVSHVWPCVALR